VEIGVSETSKRRREKAIEEERSILTPLLQLDRSKVQEVSEIARRELDSKAPREKVRRERKTHLL